MGISVRDLHNDVIKPFDNGGLASVVDYATQKVLISDTPLGNLYHHKFVKWLRNYIIFADVSFAYFPNICRLIKINEVQVL